LAERPGDDAVLNHDRDRVRHLRVPTLSRPQDLKAKAVARVLPAVEGRAVDAMKTAGHGYSEFFCRGKNA